MNENEDGTDGSASRLRDDAWIRQPLAEMKRREAQEMPSWFLPGLGGALAWSALFIWLAHETNWPRAYGFRGACVQRGCLLEAVIRSPVLLQHPSAYSVALFVWFAATAAAVLGIVLYSVITKPSPRSFLLLALVVGLTAFLALQPNSEWDL